MPIVADAAVAIRGDLSKFSGDLDKAEKQTQTLGGKLKNALSPGNLAAGLAGGFAVSQIGQFLGDAIGAASDLAETQSKVKVVFGESAKVIEKMGKTSATALGMSENAALAAAGTYGNLFRAMGITEQASADMSVGLVGLAADLASFNNMNPTEVLDKLRAGLSGETEPLRSLGVNLNVAAIAAKAMEMGLASSAAGMTPAIKAQATYALILEQTSLAQGDFSRTADGLANTQRVLNAEMENLSADIGKELLPIMVDVMHAFRDFVPHIKDAIPVVVKLTGAALELAKLAIPILVVALGRNLVGAFNKAKVAGMGLGGALAVIAAGALAYKDQLLSSAAAGIKHEIGLKRGAAAAEAFGDAYAESGGDIGKALEAVEAFTDSTQGAAAATAGAMGKMAAHIKEAEPVIAAAVHSGITDPMHKAMREAREKAVAEAKALPGDLARALVSGIPNIKDAWDAAVKLSKESLSDLNKIAYYEGVLSSKKLAAGVLDERADVRASWLAIRDDATYNLNLLTSGAADAAVNTGTTFAEQLRLQDVKIRDATSAALRQAKGIFQDTTYASDGGTAIANAWTNALNAALSSGYSVTATYIKKYQRLLGSSLPTEGPLQHPERGGKSIAEAWVQKGLVAGLRAGLGDVTAALPTLSANGGLPSMTSMALGATSAVASGATIGDTNININAPTVPMTARDIGRELRRTGVFGGTP